jgi:hypothetical protein
MPALNHGRNIGRLWAILIITSAIPATSSAHAQEGNSAELRLGAALSLARTSVAGESSSDVGPLLIGQLGVAISRRTDLTLGLAYQPFKAENPVIDEAYRAVYSLAGLEFALGKAARTYLRPELGLVFRSWSGSQAVVASETSLAAGLALGRKWRLSKNTGLALEGFIRLSGADELSTMLVGLGLSWTPIGG